MHALACAYQRGKSPDALNAALEASLPLCALIARRFSGRGADYEDLYQVASMALVGALKTFDETRGLRFSTYVTPTVTGAVRHYIRDKIGVMRTPRGLAEQYAQLKAARERLTDSLRREPSAHELADALSWPTARVLEVLTFKDASFISSLDAPAEDGRMPADVLGDLDAGYEAVEKREDLKHALRKLSNTERMLLFLRYRDKLSQRAAAEKLGLSQMQASRMERRALNTLRGEMDGQKQ